MFEQTTKWQADWFEFLLVAMAWWIMLALSAYDSMADKMGIV